MANLTTTDPITNQLPLHVKLIYGLGDWGTAAATTARNAIWLFIFLTNVVGLSPSIASLVVVIGRLWDGINDPLVGMLSDRLNTRWGRRRPFLLFGAVPFGVSFFLLFVVPPFESHVALAAYYTVVYLLIDTLYTVVNVPYAALTPELTRDYDERSKLAGWRMSISILASLVTGATFTLLAERVIANWWLGGGVAALRTGYAITAAIWGLSLIIPLLVLFFTIEEPENESEPEPFEPLRIFREVFRNRPFRLAAIIYLLSFTSLDIVLVVFIRFLIDYVQVAPGFENLIMAIVLGIALLTMPLVVKMMHWYGKRNTYIGSMMFMAVVLIIMTRVPPGGQNLVLIAAIFAGLGFGAANAIPWAIVADVVEADELQFGRRREGSFAGYLVFFRKLASALAIFVVGQALASSGFISGNSGSAFIQQPESALAMLRLFMGVVPAVLLLGSVLVAVRYPLDRAAHNAIRQKLAERRASQAKIGAISPQEAKP